MLTDNDFTDIVRQFPVIDFGFAYGSGVVKQEGYDYKRDSKVSDLPVAEDVTIVERQKEFPMVDMIFAVEDPLAWHTKNMELNPKHYTPLINMTPLQVTITQNSFGAGMWYNAMVAMNIKRYPDRLMKYGVISRQRLIKDLTQWTTLYSAGRLHKPVRVIEEGTNTAIRDALVKNNRNALLVSLLLMPDEFNELQLFHAIASLSYVGDPRMIFGENPKKIVNLVAPVIPLYRRMYDRYIEEAKMLGLREEMRQGSKVFKLDKNSSARWSIIRCLPGHFKRKFYLGGRGKHHMLFKGSPPTAFIRGALAAVVARAASGQSLKGIFTIGIAKGCGYMMAKVTKQILAFRGSVA